MIALLAAGALACSDDPARVADGGAGGSGAAPGDGGGAGGAGGQGGSGGTPKSDWEGVGFGLDWRYQGFAEVGSLAIADFVGDGTVQIAVGGRRPLLVSGDGQRQIWFTDWETTENLLHGGDNDWVYDLAAIPADGGRSDLLVTSSHGDAALLDGRDGSTIWRIFPDMRFGFPFLTRFDTAGDRAFFPYSGRAAYSATTGAELWRMPVEMVPVYVQPADQGGEVQGLFLVDEGDQLVGHGLASRPAALAAVSSEGELLFFNELAEGDMPTALGVADLEGLGTDAAILSVWGKPLQAWNADGTLRWQRELILYGTDPLRTSVQQILARDVDGDGIDELLVIASDAWAVDLERIPGMVVALEADGTERWRFGFEGKVTEAQLVDWGAEPLLLLATGLPDLGSPGAATALRLGGDEADRTLFRFQMPRMIETIAVLEEDGGRTLVLASADGVLRGIGPDGSSRWTHYLTSFLQQSTTVAVGDEDWAFFGDLHASVALLDAAGTRRWDRRLNVGSYGWTTAVATGRIDATKELRLVAAARAQCEGSFGVVETFGLDGRRLHGVVLPTEPLALERIDLDGDGIEEILVLEAVRADEIACHLRAYGEEFTLRWATPIALCQYGQLEVAALDEDGGVAIAVRTHPGLLDALPAIALVTPDGERRWKLDEELQLSLWIRAVPGGIVAGGATTERNGFVAMYEAADGAERWRTLLPPVDHPHRPDDPLPGASWFGGIVDRPEGFDVAATSYHNEAHLLDGATGEIAWSVMTETAFDFANYRHVGGPIVFVPGTTTTPPHLVMGQHDESRRRSALVAITMDGDIAGRIPMASPAWNVLLARRGDEPPSVLVQALLGIYAASVAPAP